MSKTYNGFTSNSVFERTIETLMHGFFGVILVIAVSIFTAAILGGLSVFIDSVVDKIPSVVMIS